MKYLTQKIDNLIFGYDPNEFMPIRRDGELANKGEFVLYKIKSSISR